MAVKEAGYPPQNLSGYSSDERPLTGVVDGATYHMLDTGERFVFHDGMWEADLRFNQNILI